MLGHPPSRQYNGPSGYDPYDVPQHGRPLDRYYPYGARNEPYYDQYYYDNYGPSLGIDK